MTGNPGKKEIDELVSFLPIFNKEGFEPISAWGGGELLPDGAWTFPWPIYQKEVELFFRLAGQEPWCDYDYAGKNVPVLIQDPNYIDTASLDQIKTILTFCVRGERFSDGHWGAVIEKGVIAQLLKRLQVIAEGI